MSRFTALGIATLLVTFAVACDDKKDTPAASDAGTTSTTTTASAGGSAGSLGAKVAGNDDPSEEDFEDEAEKSINAGNLESEIAKMEAELK